MSTLTISDLYTTLSNISDPVRAEMLVSTKTSFPGNVLRENVIRCLLGFELDLKFKQRAVLAYKKAPDFRPVRGRGDTLEQMIYDGPIVCQNIVSSEMFIRVAVEQIVSETFWKDNMEVDRADLRKYVPKKSLKYFDAPFPRVNKKPVWFNYALKNVKQITLETGETFQTPQEV